MIYAPWISSCVACSPAVSFAAFLLKHALQVRQKPLSKKTYQHTQTHTHTHACTQHSTSFFIMQVCREVVQPAALRTPCITCRQKIYMFFSGKHVSHVRCMQFQATTAKPFQGLTSESELMIFQFTSIYILQTIHVYISFCIYVDLSTNGRISLHSY